MVDVAINPELDFSLILQFIYLFIYLIEDCEPFQFINLFNLLARKKFNNEPLINCCCKTAAVAGCANFPPSTSFIRGCSSFDDGGVDAEEDICTCGGGAGGVATLLVGVGALGTDFGGGGSGLGQAACANLSSISFSCFKAFTKAVFNLWKKIKM